MVSEEVQKRERDTVKQELEKLCSSIQMVCSSTLPLGTCMNYVQEDMDAMQAELHTWREQNREYTRSLQQEQRYGRHVHCLLPTEFISSPLLVHV